MMLLFCHNLLLTYSFISIFNMYWLDSVLGYIIGIKRRKLVLLLRNLLTSVRVRHVNMQRWQKKIKAVGTDGGDLYRREHRETNSVLSTVKELIQGIQCKKALSRCRMVGSPNSWLSTSSSSLRPLTSYSRQHFLFLQEQLCC